MEVIGIVPGNGNRCCRIVAPHCGQPIAGPKHTSGEDKMATRKKAGAHKKLSSRKYGKAAGKSVESAVRREKKGTLRSGKGGKGGTVKSRKQAIAIGLSEARKKGAKVPKKAQS